MPSAPISTRVRLLALAALAVAVPAVGPTVAAEAKPVPATTTSSTAPVYSAHLRLSLTTTSDWTQVHISPGSIAAARLVSASGSGNLVGLSDGLGLSGVTGTTSLVSDLVWAETSGATSFTIKVNKGFVGTTTVGIENLNGAAYSVTKVTDAVSSATDSSNTYQVSVARNTLMSTTQLPMPKADSRKLVLAFYYPWWATYTDPTLADRPQNPRSVWDPSGVASMTAQAKANGVNGFVVSWHGDAKDGPAFDLARQAAEQQGQQITAYIETPEAKSATSGSNADPAVVTDWIAQALSRRSSPAFLKAADGLPVVFVYQMGYLLSWQWSTILDNLAAQGLHFHLVGDMTDSHYTPMEWGVHRYAVNDSASALTSWSRDTALAGRADAVVGNAAQPRLFAATVAPGFDDHLLRGTTNPIISRGSKGQRYDDTWNAALTGNPDWVLVTSWNEWFEDTQIEPGVNTGGKALSQTSSHSASWKSTR